MFTMFSTSFSYEIVHVVPEIIGPRNSGTMLRRRDSSSPSAAPLLPAAVRVGPGGGRGRRQLRTTRSEFLALGLRSCDRGERPDVLGAGRRVSGSYKVIRKDGFGGFVRAIADQGCAAMLVECWPVDESDGTTFGRFVLDIDAKHDPEKPGVRFPADTVLDPFRRIRDGSDDTLCRFIAHVAKRCFSYGTRYGAAITSQSGPNVSSFHVALPAFVVANTLDQKRFRDALVAELKIRHTVPGLSWDSLIDPSIYRRGAKPGALRLFGCDKSVGEGRVKNSYAIADSAAATRRRSRSWRRWSGTQATLRCSVRCGPCGRPTWPVLNLLSSALQPRSSSSMAQAFRTSVRAKTAPPLQALVRQSAARATPMRPLPRPI